MRLYVPLHILSLEYNHNNRNTLHASLTQQHHPKEVFLEKNELPRVAYVLQRTALCVMPGCEVARFRLGS